MTKVVRLLTPSQAMNWDAYAKNHACTTPFHTSKWYKAVETCLGTNTARYLYVEESDSIRGILPLFICGSRLTGRNMTALPFAGTQPSVCADDAAIETMLVNAAIELAKDLNVDWLELREDQTKNWGLPTKQGYVNMRLPLMTDPEQLWAEKVDSRVRTKVRAASRRNLHFEWLSNEGLDPFFQVYLDTMHRLGSPPHSKKLFSSIIDVYSDEAKFGIVFDGTQAVAAALVMHDGKWIGFPWAGSLTTARAKHPNNLLYWSIIKMACENGFDYLDLGRSPVNSGTLHFKKQWGAETRPLHYYYGLPDKQTMPGRDAKDPFMVFASNCWRRLPRGITDRIGPSLARLIP